MSEPLIALHAVGKMYKLFDSPRDNLLDAIGLARLAGVAAREFWALRGIDLEVGRGERLGIIGRNGAGKTTVLKLLNQAIAASEGTVEVNGRVHALMDAGAGFNQELTGAQNIQVALAYQGLGRAEIAAATADIAEFTELGGFLAQPIKTYSLGMLARLAFATATAVRPEILIIDEVLGAGDAYFFGKSSERMQSLVESGAAVVIVSHALEQVARLCPRAVWLERGSIVAAGPSMEVVTAYQEYVHRLENRRLAAKNRKRMAGAFSAEESDNRVDTLMARLVVSGPAGAWCDVERLTVSKDGEIEESLDVGAPQDALPVHPSFVVLDAGDWSAPRRGERGLCRRLACNGRRPAVGSVVVGLFLLYREARYTIESTCRCHDVERLTLEVWHGGGLRAISELVPGNDGWVVHRAELGPAAAAVSAGDTSTPAGTPAATAPTAGTRPRRWPGLGTLLIESVTLAGAGGEERTVFTAGMSMTVRVVIRAVRGGAYPLTPAATLYRLDGVLVTNLVGEAVTVTLAAGGRTEAVLDLGPLNLGDGRYLFSVAMYRRLSADESEWYDLIDRSFELEVVGNRPFDNGVFRHRGEWRVDPASRD